MSNIEVVVFDIGNVLIDWDPEQFFDNEIGETRRRKLFEEVDLYEMNARIDLGAEFTKTIYAKADEHPEWRDEIRLWHDGWLDMTAPNYGQSVKLLRALRAKGIPVFALSNFGRESFDLAVSAYPFLAEFDRSFISGHMGLVKPDPEIYRQLEDESGVAPQSLLFADDRQDNIDAALARGWNAHYFQNSLGFAQRLVAEQLLSAEEAAA